MATNKQLSAELTSIINKMELKMKEAPHWDGELLKANFKASAMIYFDAYNGIRSSVQWNVYLPNSKGDWSITGV